MFWWRLGLRAHHGAEPVLHTESHSRQGVVFDHRNVDQAICLDDGTKHLPTTEGHAPKIEFDGAG